MPQELLCRRDFIAVRDFMPQGTLMPQGILCRRGFYAVGDTIPQGF